MFWGLVFMGAFGFKFCLFVLKICLIIFSHFESTGQTPPPPKPNQTNWNWVLGFWELTMAERWIFTVCVESPVSPSSLFKVKIKTQWKLNKMLRNLGAQEASMSLFQLLPHQPSTERKHGKAIVVALWRAPISLAPRRLLIERIYQNCNTISYNVKQL